MTRFARILTTAVATAAATFAATPALAATSAVTAATASAQLVKPLVLKATVNMDFGTVLLTSLVAGSTYTVNLSSAGTLTCTTGLTCSATGKPATFNVQGSNNQLVHIYTVASNFTSGANTIQITPSAQSTVTLTSSGVPGDNFNVGASFPITSTTVEGIYTGNLNVTVDYN